MKNVGNVREEVEGPIGVLDVGHRRWFQRVDHVGKLYRVTDEKHWKVVADEIALALVSIELRGGTTRIGRAAKKEALVYGEKSVLLTKTP